MKAPSRTKRRDPGGARVTPRDLIGLEFASRAQPVTAPQWAKLLGMSLPTARARLRTLRDLKLLSVHITSLSEPSRFVLGSAAPALLARAMGASPEEFRTPSGIGTGNLAHHDGAVDLGCAITVACARNERVRLVKFHFEQQIREMLGGAPAGALVPDAAGVFEAEDGARFALAFEVDLASENKGWFRDRKAGGYTQLHEAHAPLLGQRDWRVAVVCPSLRRLHRLAEACWEAEAPEGLMYFALASELTDRSVLGVEPWRTPRVVDGTARLVEESPWQPLITNPDNGYQGQDTMFHRSNQASSPEQLGSFWRGSRP